MRDVMGIVNLHDTGVALTELTSHRPVAAVPFLGRYRIIDFVLSNMVNSGIYNVGVFAQEKPRPLTEHLGTGGAWDLDRKKDGLLIFYPYYNSIYSMYMTEMGNFRENIEYIEKSRQKYVIISPSYMICNINYNEAYDFHKSSGADITILYKKVEDASGNFLNCQSLEIDDEGRVKGFAVNKGEKQERNISMEMYIMKREYLLQLINKASQLSMLYSLKDTINYFCNEININAFEYDGYLECINSVKTYFHKSLELLDVEKAKQLFKNDAPIHTVTKDNAPTKYGKNAKVKNSFIANGAIIEGTVENSVIFRGVNVGAGTIVKNCILMTKCIIGDGVYMENIIADKNASVSRVKELIGNYNEPIVLGKNSIV